MAHVMQPGAAHFSGTYIPTVAGWVQAPAPPFHSSVPFNSKPPPVPTGVNPQTWQTGQWLINPYFRPQQGTSQGQPLWAPHGWGPAVAQAQVQAQAQASYNPHKRIPNPGDATYWATKLSDNPLGLENMHIKYVPSNRLHNRLTLAHPPSRDPVPTNERHVKEQNGVPHTPWVWVPKELTSEEANRPAFNPALPLSQVSQPHFQQTEKALPPAPPTPATHDHTRGPSTSQSAYPNLFAPTSQTRLSQQNYIPAPPLASSAVPSYAPYPQQQQRSQEIRPPDRYTSASSQLQQQQEPDATRHSRHHSQGLPRPAGGSQLYRDYRATSTPASSSASAAAAARERERTSSGGQELTSDRSNETFSQSREMHLTFSPKIIRTPDHYSSPSSSRYTSRGDEDDRTLSRTPGPHGTIYGPPNSIPSRPTPSRSNSMSAYRRSTTPTTGNASGQTSSSSLGLLTFTEEPQALLSPLVVGSTPPMEAKSSPGRDVSRSQSYPSVRNPNASVGFTGESEREGKVYPRTPRPTENPRSRLEPAEQDYHHSPDRDRSTNATPQPPTRTPPKYSPPTRTPPSRTSPPCNSRPSPESGSHYARQISRSHTYPSVLPHGTGISPPIVPPPVIPSPVSSPPPISASTSPRYGSSPSHFSSSSSHVQGQQYPASSRPSYPRMSPNANSTHSRATSPLRHNPLPRPPAVSPYAESLTRGAGSSASAAAAAHQQSSYHNQNKRTIRRGYWNRRGDYLYVTDKDERFIVYAPPPLANPEELKQYPSPTDGWLGHRGDFIKYDPKVPELLDSLPVHGAAAKRPYQYVSAVFWHVYVLFQILTGLCLSQFVQYIEV